VLIIAHSHGGRENRARGEKLNTEIPNSMMRCVCGVVFNSHDPEGSLPHRRHIYAAQGEQKRVWTLTRMSPVAGTPCVCFKVANRKALLGLIYRL
jgi:hypothetical protein